MASFQAKAKKVMRLRLTIKSSVFQEVRMNGRFSLEISIVGDATGTDRVNSLDIKSLRPLPLVSIVIDIRRP